jgi:peptidylglycine monooxygenase
MAATQSSSSLQRSSPCSAGGSHVLYAWARDAKKLELPEDVGFQVGLGTPIEYLVLQVHYAHVDKFKGSNDPKLGARSPIVVFRWLN